MENDREIRFVPVSHDIYAVFAWGGEWYVERCGAAYIQIETSVNTHGEQYTCAWLDAVSLDREAQPGPQSDVGNFYAYFRHDDPADPFGFPGTIAEWHTSLHSAPDIRVRRVKEAADYMQRTVEEQQRRERPAG